MKKSDWEYAGLLIDSFNISVRHIEPFALSEYPDKWVAVLKKSPLNRPSFTVSAWGSTASEAVINCYNKSHFAEPENPYKGIRVLLDEGYGTRPYTLRHYCPNTKQHGKIFDSYRFKDNAMAAIKLYEMELVNE